MKAIVYTTYGSPDVLHYVDIEKPSVGDDQVLIKIRAASVNALDWHYLRGTPYVARVVFGLRKPKLTQPGADVAGEVEAVGRNVTQFKPGDKVFGAGRRSFAEYVSASESKLVLKPDNVTFEQAAAVPVAALTALQGLRDSGKIQSGQKVLVDGAGGGVGTFAVQIAKSYGTEVTATCSTKNVDMVRSIGADHVIDYTQEDVTRTGRQYDLIFAANGFHSLTGYRRALNPGGSFVMAGGAMPLLFRLTVLGPLLSMTGKKMLGVMANINQQDLVYLKGLLEAGKVKPVIDRRYPLRDAADAIRYIEEGHARGKVVITLG